jgi:hypothetical protein
MVHRIRTKRGRGPRYQSVVTPEKRQGWTIAEWCSMRGVSVRTFFKWKRKGIGPRVNQPAGPKGWQEITVEADAEWRSRFSSVATTVTATTDVSTSA